MKIHSPPPFFYYYNYIIYNAIYYYNGVEVMSNLSDKWIPVRAGMPRMDECSFQE